MAKIDEGISMIRSSKKLCNDIVLQRKHVAFTWTKYFLFLFLSFSSSSRLGITVANLNLDVFWRLLAADFSVL